MEIPRSLENVWKNVSKDNNISKADYDLLVKTAAPTGNDNDLDQSEIQFLTSLKSDLEKNGGAKGSVPTSGFSFVENKPQATIKESDISEVPESLLNTWNSAIEDGTLSADDYRTLMEVAAPNWSDEELDPKEKAFLGNLQALLKQSGQDLAIEKKSAPQQSNETPKASTEESPRSAPEVDTETDSSLRDLNEVNNILDALGDDPDFAPLRSIVNQRLSNSTAAKNFSNDVNKIISEMEPGKTASLSEAKTKLQKLYDGLSAGVKANPQITNLYTHAIGTLDSQINASKTKKNNPASPSPTIPSQQSGSNIPSSLQQTWNRVSADGKIDTNDYNSLLNAAAPNKDNNEFDQQEVSFLADLQKKVSEAGGVYSFVDEPQETVNQPTASPLSDLGEVPDSLKDKMSSLVDKGNITNDDFNELVALAAPTGQDSDIDQSEKNFLVGLRSKIEESGNNLSIGNNQNIASSSSPKKPVLLNWPGYTDQTKGALKSAFGQSVAGAAMPILKASEAVKIANAFGVQNIRQLQQLVKAKVDGQFGPETFFKAKVYIANEMNKPDADRAKLESMLNALGSDEEVNIMKNDLNMLTSSNTEGSQNQIEEEESVESQSSQPTGKSNASTKTQEQSPDDGVPSTLRSSWNKVTADGKLTRQDFNALMSAASPNKKNSEFDNEELEFLATIKDMFDTNKVDVLEVQKPQGSSTTTQQTTNKPTSKPSANQKTETTSDDGVPSTLKAAWNKVTADGKLNKADFDALMKAAAPNKKNSEFDNSELEFLATIKDMFDKNKVDVLDVQKPTSSASKPAQKPQSTTTTQQPKPVTVSSKSFSPPESLKSAWLKSISDGKFTSSDFEALMKAAAPNKQNVEFENDEIEFLADLKKKLESSGGSLTISK